MASKHNTPTFSGNGGIPTDDIKYLQSLRYKASPDGRDVLFCNDEKALPVRINNILKAARIPGADNAAEYKVREDHVAITGRHPVSYIERLGAHIEGKPDAPQRG